MTIVEMIPFFHRNRTSTIQRTFFGVFIDGAFNPNKVPDAKRIVFLLLVPLPFPSVEPHSLVVIPFTAFPFAMHVWFGVEEDPIMEDKVFGLQSSAHAAPPSFSSG